MLLRQLPDLIYLIKEHAVVWLIAAVGLSISVSAFLVIQEQFRTQRSAEFNWVAHNRSRLLETRAGERAGAGEADERLYSGFRQNHPQPVSSGGRAAAEP